MSSPQDRPGRGHATTVHEAGTGVAIGAAVGGLAGLLWALLRNKKLDGGGEDDYPIIIKSGSLSVCIKDSTNGDIVEMRDDHYQVTSDAITGMKYWNVSVVESISGWPVQSTAFTDVANVVLEVVDEVGDAVDTITITFKTDSLGSTGQKVLLVEADKDRHFGRNTGDRSIKKSKKHKRRAISKEINGEKDFGIASVTLNYPQHSKRKPDVCNAGDDYTLACTFYK